MKLESNTEETLYHQMVRRDVERIAEIADDYEAAHAAEIELHKLVLEAVAEERAFYPDECAREALRTRDIVFKRVCA